MNSVRTDISDVKEDVKGVKNNQTGYNEKLNNEINSIKDDLNNVKNQPDKSKAEWWDKVIWLVVGGALTAIVTGVIDRITN